MVKRLSLLSPSDHLLLGVSLILLWGAFDSTTAETTSAGSTAQPTTTTPIPTTTTTRAPPDNVKDVRVVARNETSITLEWDQVENIRTYSLTYNESSGPPIPVNASSAQSVKYVVSPLAPGKRYFFTVFTVDGDASSSGYSFSEVTVPENVDNVTVKTQNETSITLEWPKVGDILDYTLHYSESGTNRTESVTGSAGLLSVTHVVSSLTAGTSYTFMLFALFEGVPSSAFTKDAPTAPLNTKWIKAVDQNETSITLQWEKVNNVQDYILEFNEKKIDIGASEVTRTISGLTSGTKYNFTLFSVFQNVTSSGEKHVAVTAPKNVEKVKIVSETETNVTLEWEMVQNISDYTIQNDNKSISVYESRGVTSIRRVVSLPDAGREYNLTLFTVFEGVKSDGHKFQVVSVPLKVRSIRVPDRLVTSVTLEWDIVNADWDYRLLIGGEITLVPPSSSSIVISHPVPSLQPGTRYTFSVISVFKGRNSTAVEGSTVTAIDCSLVDWHVTSTSIQGTVEGLFTSSSATYEAQSHDGGGDKTVSFSGLYPGVIYEIRLDYNKNAESYHQCSHQLQIPPSDPKGHCEYEASGYSVRVVWDEPYGVWSHVEVNVSEGQKLLYTNEDQHAVIPGFQPAQTYKVSLGLRSGSLRSQRPFVFDCSTDPRGVIAGSVMGVLLFILLVCVVAFILLRRPDIISKKSFFGRSKQPVKKNATIPVAKFPDHFAQLSMDENRGFSLEYESLSPVGTDQTKKVSVLPENKAKNRFTNVLPYDWNRVKLSTSDPAGSSDYINANYMPGYNSNKEFIATQGPLPSTLSDFWRMVWEQRVRGIVMVTNCSENGRTKCEQYWPEVSQNRLYGELSVTTCSEQKTSNWTLREFRLKNKNDTEERVVKHFHFTAWPDHGVPQGTEVLIQFRSLVRQHIDSEGTKAPTVVHCSAGVGRTGTIIALDMLLQQLERERAVGINGFVHRMRLNRPFMVQTESQYVFLHQCIMDSLPADGRPDEHIYENSDMIYENATALQELRQTP